MMGSDKIMTEWHLRK